MIESKYKHLLGSMAVSPDLWRRYTKFLTLMENPDEVLRKDGKKIGALRSLENDSHVYSCIQSRKSGTKSLKWEISRGGARDEQVIFLENIFNDLNIEAIIDEMLDAPLYGFKVLEVLYQYNSNGQLIPVDIVGKPHEWFAFDQLNQCHYLTNYSITDSDLLPPRKFMVVQHGASYNNPYGRAVLSKCYWPVIFKRDGQEFWSIFLEKFGIPFINIQHEDDASQDDIEAMIKQAVELRLDGVVTTPTGTQVQILNTERTSSPALFKEWILYNNSEISKAILSQTLTTEQGDTGSYAMSQTHLQVRQDIIDSDRGLVERWFNKLIQWILELNYGGYNESDVPKFTLYQEADVDMTLAQRDQILASTGQIRFTKSYFQKNYGLKDDDFEVVEPQVAMPFAEEEHAHDTISDGVNQAGFEDFKGSVSQELIGPIVEKIAAGNYDSFDELQAEIIDMFPSYSTVQIEEILANSLLMADVAGRSNP